jgi:putative type I restriction-modification system, helicase subunit
MIEKTCKVQENHVYDFIFDDGYVKNIKIIDKKNIHNNFLQVRLLEKELNATATM